MRHLTPYESETLSKIIKLVALYNEVHPEEITKGHDDESCLRRYKVYFVAYFQFKIPVSSIQKYFNHRQHGTVINGLKRIDGWRKSNTQIKESLDTLIRSLDHIPIRKFPRQLNIPIHHTNNKQDGAKKDQAKSKAQSQ